MPDPPAGPSDSELDELAARTLAVAPTPLQKEVQTPYFSSTLEVPNELAAPQNAKLTLRVSYSLVFIDQRNLRRPAYRDDKGNALMDDGNSVAFTLRDWDYLGRTNFARQFEKAGEFWNNRFCLRTPGEYSGLSFPALIGGALISWLPDVDCSFRLAAEEDLYQLVVYAVRPVIWRGHEFIGVTKIFKKGGAEVRLPETGESGYLSDFGHELGHVIANRATKHIGSLLHTAGCGLDDNAPACYREPPGVAPNIEGSRGGTGLVPENAGAWQAAMEAHTNVSRFKWRAVVK